MDPHTHEPFYVGKGTNKRMYEHYRTRTRLKNPLLRNKLLKLAASGLKPGYLVYANKLEESKSFEIEKRLISIYGKRIDRTGILCNLTDGGEGNSAPWTNERKQQHSNKMKLLPRRLPIMRRSVVQYNLDGTELATFESAKVAGETTNSNASYIIQCCKKKRVSSGGFLWAYKGEEPSAYTKKYYRKVEQWSLDGERLNTYPSLTAAQIGSGVQLHNISECCREKSKTAGGFVWRYVT